MLASGKKITRLGIKMKTGPDGKEIKRDAAFWSGEGWNVTAPATYAAGKKVPDDTLSELGDTKVDTGGANVVLIKGKDKKLSDLWAEANKLAVKGKVVRVFWAACGWLDIALTKGEAVAEAVVSGS